MATYAQRAQSIGDALLNTVATASQLNRLGRALAYSEARLAEYDAATQAVKAQLFVDMLRNHLVSYVRSFESSDAVNTAVTNTANTVNADFTPTP